MSNYNYNDHYNGPSPGPGPGRRPPNGDFAETLSWAIDIALIFAWFPAGLILTVAHAAGHDLVGSIICRGKNIKRAASEKKASARTYQTPRPEETAADAAGAREEKREKKQDGGVRRADAGAKVKTVFGWLLAVFGVIGTIGTAGTGTGIWTMLTWAAAALGGGALALSGHMSRRKEAAFRRCVTVSGTTGVVDIAKLSKTLGLTGPEADRRLTEMIDRGYYGPRAYIDHERGLLVIEPEAMRDVFRAEDEARARAKEKAAEQGGEGHITTQSIYDAYVEKIRQADAKIADETMSAKIRRMQTAAAAIFREVEEHPEKKPQIQRFMNYYLPTTLKLLDAYARIETQGVTGENMARAKADIERIAETLAAGYEKQLDTLYRAEAVDIAGDVDIIENMMRRDGLAGQNDFRPGGQTMGGQ